MARRTPSQLNMLLAVDKPVGFPSHDVVSQCRRALHERRVGHAGTLDPMASGVMVVGVGQATRLLGMLTLDTKSYVADISFGAETNTDDAEGEAVRTVAVANELRDPAYAREHLAAMLGPQMQVPPAFSAISVNGVRAYKSAREGNAVDLPPRPVEVYAADLIAVGGDAINAIATVIKALWDNVIDPLANWLLSTFGPVFTQVFNSVAGIVTNAIGIVADVLGDQSHGTNVEAPLDTIKQAVAEVMEDLQAGQMAGFEAVVSVLREILSAVYGIELTDEDVGRAVQRWQRKQLTATGGV